MAGSSAAANVSMILTPPARLTDPGFVASRGRSRI
jgi:hypothetical protein